MSAASELVAKEVEKKAGKPEVERISLPKPSKQMTSTEYMLHLRNAGL